MGAHSTQRSGDRRRLPTPPDEALRAYVAQDGWERVACWEGERVGHVDLFMRSPIPPIQSPTCQSLKDTP
jgi:hypothetical protein